MSTQINPQEIDFDPEIGNLISQLRKVKNEIATLQEVADLLTERIKSAMGDAVTGTLHGQPVVRWTVVESKRFDTKKAREVLPQQVIDLLEIRSQSRRFTLLDGSETW